MNESQVDKRRESMGSGLIYFTALVLGLSSLFKFLHPQVVVAYLGSMGYEGSTLFLIAWLELLTAVMFWFPRARAFGLLLVSSYFGGAIAAHLAVHRYSTGGPFLVYMANHPYIGAIEPAVPLAAAWIGAWLRHPEVLRSLATPIARFQAADCTSQGVRNA